MKVWRTDGGKLSGEAVVGWERVRSPTTLIVGLSGE